MLKLHGQALAQRVVKHRVAGGVVEIREDDRVPFGESRGSVKVEVGRRRNDGGKRNSSGYRHGLGGDGPTPPRARAVLGFGVPFHALQVVSNVCGALIARLAIGLQTLGDDALERRRFVEAQLDRRYGPRPFRHFIEHQPECPEIGAVIDRFSAGLLRSHVRRGAENLAASSRGGEHRALVVRVGFAHLGDTEIENLRVTAIRDEDIGGLDVAMNDARVVCGIERVRDLDAEGKQDVERQTAIGDSVSQRGALEVLHDDEGAAILLADIVNGADVGVIQRRRGPRLAAKPAESVGLASQFFGQELHRDEPMEPFVLRLVDDAHPARADPLEDAVVGYGAAEQRVEAAVQRSSRFERR